MTSCKNILMIPIVVYLMSSVISFALLNVYNHYCIDYDYNGFIKHLIMGQTPVCSTMLDIIVKINTSNTALINTVVLSPVVQFFLNGS